MELHLIKEHKDGSATFSLETTKEETEMLVSYGLKKLLEEYVKKDTWSVNLEDEE